MEGTWRILVLLILAVGLSASESDHGDDKRCICKPSMNIAWESPERHICNNATFTWLLGTVLEQVSKQSEGLDVQRQELDSSRILLQECQDQIQQGTDALASKDYTINQLHEDHHHLAKENADLLEEIEKLKAQRAHVDIRPKDCADVLRYGYHYSGIYTIYPLGYEQDGFPVFCDLNTQDGGWLVFQRRQDGSESFARDWASYQQGFGVLAKEFWLGNDKLHAITQQRKYQLRVDLVDFDGRLFHATYDNFKVDGAENLYTLHLGSYEGDAGDALKHHDGAPFSTVDQDHDKSRSGNCAELYGHGGWWWVRCYDSNLNGIYGNRHAYEAIVWYQLHSNHEPMRHVEMKIRPIK